MLTIRYGLGWITLGSLITTASVFTSILPTVGEFLGMSPTGFLLVLASVILLAVCFQLSIALSSLKIRFDSLVQEQALEQWRKDERDTAFNQGSND